MQALLSFEKRATLYYSKKLSALKENYTKHFDHMFFLNVVVLTTSI